MRKYERTALTNFKKAIGIKEVFKKPSVTVDAVVYSGSDILLIKRKNDPFKNCWALPGGFLDVDKDVSLEKAMLRELKEETSLDLNTLDCAYSIKQLGAYGDIKRDPRERVITVAYTVWCPDALRDTIKAKDDAKEVKWFPSKKLPKLAFDHKQIIKDSIPPMLGILG